MSIFDSIWHFISRIFDSLEKEWHKLEQPIKNALMWGSGVANEITTNIDATPQFVLDLIKAKFPTIDIEKVKAAIAEVSKDIAGAQTVPSDDIYTTLTNLQKYFEGLGDKEWEREVSTFAQKLASVFAPEATPFATLVTFIEFVYRKFVKN